MENTCNRVAVFFSCLLIYFLPISTALTESFAGAVILTYIVKRIWQANQQLHQLSAVGRPVGFGDRLKLFGSIFTIADSPLNKPMGVFAFFVLFSVFQSPFFMASLGGFFGKFVEGYMLFLSFADCFKTKQHVRNFLGVYFVVALLISFNGIFQFVTNTEFIHGRPLEDNRASSCLRHANDLAGYLVLIIPPFLSILLWPVQRWSWREEWKNGSFGGGTGYKRLIFLVFILIVVCMGLTYSRSGWVAFILGLLALASFRKGGFSWVIGITIVFLAVFVPTLNASRNVSFLADDVSRGVMENRAAYDSRPWGQRMLRDLTPYEFSGMGRATFWEEATDLIKNKPFFGNGLNTYSKMTKSHKYYAHNCYLQMAAEIGIVGLTAFLVMLAFVFYGPVMDLSKTADPFLYSVQAGLLAGLTGFLIQSGFDTSFYSVKLSNLMWIFIGLITAVHRLSAVRNN